MSKSPHTGKRASPLLTTPYLSNPSHHKKTHFTEDGSPCCSTGCQGPSLCNPLRWWRHPNSHKSQQCNLQWLQLSQNGGLPVSQNRSCLFSLSSPFPHYIFIFHRLNIVSRYNPHPATGGRVSGGKGPFIIVVLQSASPARRPVPACTVLNTL